MQRQQRHGSIRTLIRYSYNLKSGEIIVTKSGSSEFSDSIISEFFNAINDTLTENGISVLSVTHQNYADRVILKKQEAIFIFDIFLNSEGFITTIYPIKCNNPELYDIVKTIFNEFIVNHGKPLAASE